MQALYYFCGIQPPNAVNKINSSPIWIMGREYTCSKSESNENLVAIQKKITEFPGAEEDFFSRITMTYRKDFPMIFGSFYTSDMGWGCMHRTGQMILAQAFICHYLGRDWRISENSLPTKYYEILQHFADKFNAPYSIHRIALYGDPHDKCVGEWYGPSTVSFVLKKLVEKFQPDEFGVYVSDDGSLYKNEIEQLCQLNGEWKKSLIIFIPLRLGLDRIPEQYFDAIRSVFQFPQNIGIAGGKPKSSLYFIGYQGDLLFYLDPHVTIPPSVEMSTIPFNATSYHPDAIRNMKMNDIDPSIAIGFYCKDKTDFEDFCTRTQILENCSQLFTISESRPVYTNDSVSWPESEVDSIDLYSTVLIENSDDTIQQNDESTKSRVEDTDKPSQLSRSNSEYVDDFLVL